MSEGGVLAKPIPSLKGSAATHHPGRVGLWKFKAQCRQSVMFFGKKTGIPLLLLFARNILISICSRLMGSKK